MFCTICGTKAIEGDTLCNKCGTPLKALSETPLQNTPPESTAPQNFAPPGIAPVHATPQGPQLSQAQHSHKSAAGVFCAGLALTLVALIFAFIPNRVTANYAITFLTPLLPIVLGFGFCLIYKGNIGYRIFGSVGLLAFAIIITLARAMLNLYTMTSMPLAAVFTNIGFLRNLGYELLRCILIAALAIAGGIGLRGKNKYSLMALAGTAVVLIIGLLVNWVQLRSVFLSAPNLSPAVRIIYINIVGAGFFMLAAMLAHMTTASKSGRLHLSGGARAWCIIVSCLMGLSVLFNIIAGDPPTVFQSLLLVPTVVGMIILSTGRRFGFTLALLGAGMSVMIALTRIFPFFPSTFATSIGYIFGGCINPLITWLVIAREWRGQSPVKNYPPPYGIAQQQVNMPMQQPPIAAQQTALPIGFQGAAAPTTAGAGTWSRKVNGGSVYYSQNAGSLYAASEILKGIAFVPPQTYYMMDTPDGTLGRDVNGFFTEGPIKTANLKTEKPGGALGSVESQSLVGFGDMMKNQSGTAMIKKSGQYAKLVLMMKCGQCGYESPVETEAGEMERQCYSCGTINRTCRGAISVYTAYGTIEI